MPAGGQLDGLVADEDRHAALEDVEALVLGVVDVQRGLEPGGRGDLEQGVLAAGVGGGGLDLGQHAEEPALLAEGGGGLRSGGRLGRHVPPDGAGGVLGRTTRATIITRRKFVKEMSPRNYDMSKRAAAAAQTRQRIVDATRALHAEQGIAATSWDDIAARAGVGVGTVYRHFPSLDELVPACGDVTMQVARAPGRVGGARALRRRRGPGRAHRAARARGVRDLRARRAGAARDPPRARRAPDASPRPASELEASLDRARRRALRPLATPEDRAVARALIDLGTWQALRDQGLGPAGSVAAIAGLLAARLTARQP